MKFLDFFLLLWVIFALLDPDPLTRLNPDPDPQPCLEPWFGIVGEWAGRVCSGWRWSPPGCSTPCPASSSSTSRTTSWTPAVRPASAPPPSRWFFPNQTSFSPLVSSNYLAYFLFFSCLLKWHFYFGFWKVHVKFDRNYNAQQKIKANKICLKLYFKLKGNKRKI